MSMYTSIDLARIELLASYNSLEKKNLFKLVNKVHELETKEKIPYMLDSNTQAYIRNPTGLNELNLVINKVVLNHCSEELYSTMYDSNSNLELYKESIEAANTSRVSSFKVNPNLIYYLRRIFGKLYTYTVTNSGSIEFTMNEQSNKLAYYTKWGKVAYEVERMKHDRELPIVSLIGENVKQRAPSMRNFNLESPNRSLYVKNDGVVDTESIKQASPLLGHVTYRNAPLKKKLMDISLRRANQNYALFEGVVMEQHKKNVSLNDKYNIATQEIWEILTKTLGCNPRNVNSLSGIYEEMNNVWTNEQDILSCMKGIKAHRLSEKFSNLTKRSDLILGDIMKEIRMKELQLRNDKISTATNVMNEENDIFKNADIQYIARDLAKTLHHSYDPAISKAIDSYFRIIKSKGDRSKLNSFLNVNVQESIKQFNGVIECLFQDLNQRPTKMTAVEKLLFKTLYDEYVLLVRNANKPHLDIKDKTRNNRYRSDEDLEDTYKSNMFNIKGVWMIMAILMLIVSTLNGCNAQSDAQKQDLRNEQRNSVLAVVNNANHFPSSMNLYEYDNHYNSDLGVQIPSIGAEEGNWFNSLPAIQLNAVNGSLNLYREISARFNITKPQTSLNSDFSESEIVNIKGNYRDKNGIEELARSLSVTYDKVLAKTKDIIKAQEIVKDEFALRIKGEGITNQAWMIREMSSDPNFNSTIKNIVALYVRANESIQPTSEIVKQLSDTIIQNRNNQEYLGCSNAELPNLISNMGSFSILQQEQIDLQKTLPPIVSDHIELSLRNCGFEEFANNAEFIKLKELFSEALTRRMQDVDNYENILRDSLSSNQEKMTTKKGIIINKLLGQIDSLTKDQIHLKETLGDLLQQRNTYKDVLQGYSDRATTSEVMLSMDLVDQYQLFNGIGQEEYMYDITRSIRNELSEHGYGTYGFYFIRDQLFTSIEALMEPITNLYARYDSDATYGDKSATSYVLIQLIASFSTIFQFMRFQALLKLIKNSTLLLAKVGSKLVKSTARIEEYTREYEMPSNTPIVAKDANSSDSVFSTVLKSTATMFTTCKYYCHVVVHVLKIINLISIPLNVSGINLIAISTSVYNIISGLGEPARVIGALVGLVLTGGLTYFGARPTYRLLKKVSTMIPQIDLSHSMVKQYAHYMNKKKVGVHVDAIENLKEYNRKDGDILESKDYYLANTIASLFEVFLWGYLSQNQLLTLITNRAINSRFIVLEQLVKGSMHNSVTDLPILKMVLSNFLEYTNADLGKLSSFGVVLKIALKYSKIPDVISTQYPLSQWIQESVNIDTVKVSELNNLLSAIAKNDVMAQEMTRELMQLANIDSKPFEIKMTIENAIAYLNTDHPFINK